MNDTRQDLMFETLPRFYIRVVIDRLRFKGGWVVEEGLEPSASGL